MANVNVSVIVPVHNAENTISACVDSILQQTYKDLEVIVVDDHSSDLTPTILKEFERNYSNVRVITNRVNVGPGGARNVGIMNAKGEFLAFLDSDDTWMSNKLELQMPWFEDPTIGAVTCLGRYKFDESSILGSNYSGDIFDRTLEAATTTFQTDSLVIRSSIMDDIGGFYTQVRIGEDLITWLRIAERTKFYCVNAVLYVKGNIGNITTEYRLHIECDKFVRKYLFDTYKNRLTPAQKWSLNKNFHYATGFHYRALGEHFKASWHLFRSWLIDPLNMNALKASVYSGLTGLHLVKYDG